ncbi:hypothetical protein ACJZ2D_005057 [Fusarium nematophilum]
MLILALEVVTQLQDESATQHEADVLDEMAKASRAPLIRLLECGQEQLSQLIARGNTSLKRLLFTKAHLAQIRAMESGQPVKQAIYEVITKTLRDCVMMLREVRAGETPQESSMTADSLIADLLPFEIFSADDPMEWDIPSLLGFPPLDKDGQAQWPTTD